MQVHRKLAVLVALSIPMMVFAAFASGAQTSPDKATSNRTSPNRAIIDGRHVQPRGDQFGGADTPRDLPQHEAGEVGRLYEQLIRGDAPSNEARRERTSAPPK